MLIKTIAFEIPNGTAAPEEFLIEFTEENYAKVLQHRYTRAIVLAKTFDFQFEKEERMPVEFISWFIWLALLPEMEKYVTIGYHNAETDTDEYVTVKEEEAHTFVIALQTDESVNHVWLYDSNLEIVWASDEAVMETLKGMSLA